MILSGLWPGFQGHGIFQVEYLKNGAFWGKKLLQNTNRKPYPIYGMVPLSMTVSDLWPQFQVHDIFDIEYLRNDTR